MLLNYFLILPLNAPAITMNNIIATLITTNTLFKNSDRFNPMLTITFIIN